jgi:hypothetical protein
MRPDPSKGCMKLSQEPSLTSNLSGGFFMDYRMVT